ncbi:MAG TPA: hypothetical protein VMH32_18400 [Burkholderiales bacterium]|nr:hypothetical protein [Burkholderiales bacterium]
MLDRKRRQTRADRREHGFTALAVLARHADLDQLMAFQVDVDLVQHGVGQAFFADRHHRVQFVRAGFEGLALKRGQGASHRMLFEVGFY